MREKPKVPIEHACSCGAKLKVKDELEGRKVKCPKCSRVSTVAAVTTKPEMISVQCRCGKHYQAKMSMSGKTFQCTSCQESVSIPNLNRTTVEDDQDPFAANVSTSDSAGFFDGNLPDLAIPSAPYVPYQPPVKATTTKEVRAAKPAGFNVQFAQDTLVIVTSILCILFGLSRLVFLNPLFIILNPSVLLSFGGILYLANILVCFGILVAGIGLLLQQEWSIGAGQIGRAHV